MTKSAIFIPLVSFGLLHAQEKLPFTILPGTFPDAIAALGVSRDYKYLVVASGNVQVWSFPEGGLVRKFTRYSKVMGIDFSSDGGSLRVMDQVGDGKFRMEILSFPDGKEIKSVDAEAGDWTEAWPRAAAALHLDAGDYSLPIVYCDDNSGNINYPGEGFFIGFSQRKGLSVLTFVQNGMTLKKYEADTFFTVRALSPGGRYLLLGGEDRKLRILDIKEMFSAWKGKKDLEMAGYEKSAMRRKGRLIPLIHPKWEMISNEALLEEYHGLKSIDDAVEPSDCFPPEGSAEALNPGLGRAFSADDKRLQLMRQGASDSYEDMRNTVDAAKSEARERARNAGGYGAPDMLPGDARRIRDLEANLSRIVGDSVRETLLRGEMKRTADMMCGECREKTFKCYMKDFSPWASYSIPCARKLNAVQGGFISDVEAVKAVLAAGNYAGAKYPSHLHEGKSGDPHNLGSCKRSKPGETFNPLKAASYRFYPSRDIEECVRVCHLNEQTKELPHIFPMDNFKELVRETRKKLEKKGCWFPSSEESKWAQQLENRVAEENYRPDKKELERYSEIVYRMKTFDPSYYMVQVLKTAR